VPSVAKWADRIDDSTYHCSIAWPPLRSTARPLAGKGVKASLLKLVKNPDGYLMVSYNNHPLYADARSKGFGLLPDRKPGDERGQGFYGIWYVVTPSGKLWKRDG
jgi:predicted lipoprotein with Yx(FWY)xxD motif